jgi:poly(beta-D-mannuronate) lyase
MLTLRHGNRCLVEGNFFLARHKPGSGGIRVIGEDHTVVNNYIDGVMQGAFWITSGIPDSPLNGYFQARRCLIAFNTVVDSRGPCVEADAGFGSSGRTLRPDGITIANNLFALPNGETLLKGTESAGFKWLGNLLTQDSPAFTHGGLRIADAKLLRAKDGLWRPVADGAAHGSAAGEFPAVKTDIDGQPRREHPDAGCDQYSEAPTTSRPLTALDAGPAWRHPAE